jgi:prevent-host-death family protein
MRTASIRDLHIHTSELVREVAEGAVIVIERRGEPVAELRPLSAADSLSPEIKKKIRAEMEQIWSSLPMMSDSTPGIEEDRNR